MQNNNSYPLSLGLDHPSVQQVVEIAVELTNEHKFINSELLYNRAKRELKIPGSGLKRIIQMLLNRKILVDGSKFTKETVLKNEFRLFIYRTIKNNIGAHFSFLKDNVSQQIKGEIGAGHLIWHLEKLLKFNLIKKIKVKNYTIFLPIEIQDDIGILYFILRDNLNRRIVKFLLQHKFVNRADIYKELELNREKTYYRINNLIELEVLLLKEEENIVFVNLNKKNLIEDIISNFLHKTRIERKPKLISVKL